MRRQLSPALLSALIAACDGSGGASGRAPADTGQADAAMVAEPSPQDMAADGPPGSLLPGGAVDVLQREGWRVETGQADDG